MINKIKKLIVRKLDDKDINTSILLKKNLEKYEYISFDLFDTLVKRDVYSSKEVFNIVGKYTGIKDFSNKRIEAEKKALTNTINEEATISDIYKYIDIDKSYRKIAFRTELNVEKNINTINDRIRLIYKWCLENNKKILIVSDMYLDKDTITEILEENGFRGYYKIYLSSNIGKTKRSGKLFKYILDDLKIKSSDIIHIGNSYIADYRNPKRLNIQAIKIKTNSNVNSSMNLCRSNINSLNDLDCFIKNHINKNNGWYFNFGYSCFGPALVGFCKWLFSELKKDNRKYAVFLGRDGYIIKKVYDALGYNKIIKSQYLEASRRCFRIPSYKQEMSVYEILETLSINPITSINEVIEAMGLDEHNYDFLFTELDIDPKKKYIYSDLKKRKSFIRLLEILKENLFEESITERKSLIKYLEQFSWNCKIGIVDIGWGGWIQKKLDELLNELGYNSDICGYYFGVSKRANEYFNNTPNKKLKGYYFDCYNGNDKYDVQESYLGFFETLFIAQIGSVKYFYDENGITKIKRAAYEFDEHPACADFVSEIQGGAKRFAIEFKKSILFKILNDRNVYMYKLLRVATNPSKIELKNFENFYYGNSGNINKLIVRRNIFFFIFHFKTFLYEFLGSYWKIGYLKSIFRVKFNYLFICNRILFPMADFISKLKKLNE